MRCLPDVFGFLAFVSCGVVGWVILVETATATLADLSGIF